MINCGFNEDCFITLTRMNDNFLDLVITSPPYDNLRNYNGYFFNFEAVVTELYRVVKQGGVVVWIIGDQTKKGTESGTSFKHALYFKEIGFNLHDTMIFQKSNPPPVQWNRYQPSFEYMFVFSKGQPKTFNVLMEDCLHPGNKKNRNTEHKATNDPNYSCQKKDVLSVTKDQKYRSNIWQYVVGTAKSTAGSHTAPFPEDLVKDHILSWSNEGDLIYDPFSGSGTTAKVAKELKRNYIFSEISEEYFKESLERING